jgi:hypothetical protein
MLSKEFTIYSFGTQLNISDLDAATDLDPCIEFFQFFHPFSPLCWTLRLKVMLLLAIQCYLEFAFPAICGIPVYTPPRHFPLL